MYNVREHLAECLDSIASQDVEDLEVILVEDGSGDGSAELARDYAEGRPGWRFVPVEHGGLGRARNIGVTHARGEYLAFADSDDLVLPGAYSRMVATLEESGSDFAVAPHQRNWPEGVGVRARGRLLHRERRLGITIDAHPLILSNVFAWNKMFRRSAWDAMQLRFMEGVRYEDQPLTTEAYLRSTFDVMVRPVYLWRIRDDASSLTQKRHELTALRDRIVTKRATTEVVRRYASPRASDVWFREVMTRELPTWLREIPGSDDAWWSMLRDGIRDLWAGGVSPEESALPAHMRLVAWLVSEDRRSDCEAVLAYAEERDGQVATELRDGRRVALLPFLDDPASGVPPEVFRVRRKGA